MRRRAAIALAGLAMALPAFVAAQARRPFRIGWLFGGVPKAADLVLETFTEAMREKGFVQGEDYVFVARYARGNPQLFPELARELVAAKPDVLLSVETSARALVKATASVPIVLLTSIDPVSAGLVKSLARPGTNVTGMVDLYDQLVAKHVELLLEIVPKASRLALLNDRHWSGRERYERFAREATAARDLELEVAFIGNVRDVDAAFDFLKSRHVDGVIVAATGGAIQTWRASILEAARKRRLPAVYAFERYADEGGLLSYGPSILDNTREAADFAVRILNGASAPEMPLRQTKKFYLVANLKEARSMGITMPPSLLLRADRVIE